MSGSIYKPRLIFYDNINFQSNGIDVSDNGLLTGLGVYSQDSKNYIQTGQTTSGQSWTHDTNTDVYYLDIAVTFNRAFRAGTTPTVLANPSTTNLATGTAIQINSESETGFNARIWITTFNPGSTSQVFSWIAIGEVQI